MPEVQGFIGYPFKLYAALVDIREEAGRRSPSEVLSPAGLFGESLMQAAQQDLQAVWKNKSGQIHNYYGLLHQYGANEQYALRKLHAALLLGAVVRAVDDMLLKGGNKLDPIVISQQYNAHIDGTGLLPFSYQREAGMNRGRVLFQAEGEPSLLTTIDLTHPTVDTILDGLSIGRDIFNEVLSDISDSATQATTRIRDDRRDAHPDRFQRYATVLDQTDSHVPEEEVEQPSIVLAIKRLLAR